MDYDFLNNQENLIWNFKNTKHLMYWNRYTYSMKVYMPKNPNVKWQLYGSQNMVVLKVNNETY